MVVLYVVGGGASGTFFNGACRGARLVKGIDLAGFRARGDRDRGESIGNIFRSCAVP